MWDKKVSNESKLGQNYRNLGAGKLRGKKG